MNLSNLALASLVEEMAVNMLRVLRAVKTGRGHVSVPNNRGISKQLLTQKYTAINHLEHHALKHQLYL